MSDITLETKAYAKIILHAAKYPHCAVNGVLLATATKGKDGSRNQDMEIVDSIPMFHHSHYVSPMAEIALTQVNLTNLTNSLSSESLRNYLNLKLFSFIHLHVDFQ